MHYYDAILMDSKLTQPWHVFCDVFLKDKNWYSLSYLFLIGVHLIKNEKRLDVSSRCNFILMYFFKVILFQIEIFQVLRYLRTLTEAWRSLEDVFVVIKL